MEQILANLSGKVRRESFNGRDYLVAPLTLIVPGVLNGSKGSLYYPPDEVGRDPGAWNGMPLVVYHPTLPDGTHVSGRDPGIIEKQGVGYVYRAHVGNDGKLRAEGWFDREYTGRISPGVLTSLESGRTIELSTGLFTDNYPADPNAIHNSPSGPRPYSFVARNYRPDHVAILPDQIGACSVQDGCGVLVNKDGTLNYGHKDCDEYEDEEDRDDCYDHTMNTEREFFGRFWDWVTNAGGESFFSSCDRDDKGHCTSGGGASGGSGESGASHHPAVVDALKKILARPSLKKGATPEQVEEEARNEHFNNPALAGLHKSSKDTAKAVLAAFADGAHLGGKAKGGSTKAAAAPKAKPEATKVELGGQKPVVPAAKPSASSEPSADPMEGHPWAGKSSEEMAREINKLGSPSYGAGHNDLNYTLNRFPKGVDGVAVGGTIVDHLTAHKAKNSLTRPTLPEIYDTVREKHPGITVRQFQDTLAHLHAKGAITLGAWTQNIGQGSPFPQDKLHFIMPLDKEKKYFVSEGRKSWDEVKKTLTGNALVRNTEASFFQRFWSWVTNAHPNQPRSKVSGKLKPLGAGTGKGDAHEAAQAGAIALSDHDKALGADAYRQLGEGGSNPASWVEDETTWEKAKEAADKGNYGEGDNYWSVVSHIYKKMGGGVKEGTANAESDTESHHPTQVEETMTRGQALQILTANCSCQKDRTFLGAMSDKALITMAGQMQANATSMGMMPRKKGPMEDQVEEDTRDDELEVDSPEDATEEGLTEDTEDEQGNPIPPKEGMPKKEVKYPTGNQRGNRRGMLTRALTANEWMGIAPPEIRSAVQNAMEIEKAERLKLVQGLVSNVQDPNQRKAIAGRLLAKSIGELRDLSLMVPQAPPQPLYAPVTHQPLFTGAAGGPVSNQYEGGGSSGGYTTNEEDDLLPLPTINWSEAV